MIEIVKKHYIYQSSEINLDGKNSWIFGRMSHNTCTFVMQNISSFW